MSSASKTSEKAMPKNRKRAQFMDPSALIMLLFVAYTPANEALRGMPTTLSILNNIIRYIVFCWPLPDRGLNAISETHSSTLGYKMSSLAGRHLAAFLQNIHTTTTTTTTLRLLRCNQLLASDDQATTRILAKTSENPSTTTRILLCNQHTHII
jgi:hypothetical protein